MRFAVNDSSALGSHRVFQNISFPLKNARLTPASRAVSTLVRCEPAQYSSWPVDRNTLWFSRSGPRMDVSNPLRYVTSYPLASRNLIIGTSVAMSQLVDRALCLNGRLYETLKAARGAAAGAAAGQSTVQTYRLLPP